VPGPLNISESHKGIASSFELAFCAQKMQSRGTDSSPQLGGQSFRSEVPGDLVGWLEAFQKADIVG